MNENTYDLNKKWYTTTPASSEELDKLLLILHSFGYDLRGKRSTEMQRNTWIASPSKPNITTYGDGLSSKDFNAAQYTFIPIDYLLSL